MELREDQKRQQRHAEEQQQRLDDLYPRRRNHSAEEDVDQHDGGDERHGPFVCHAEHQAHEIAGADHLRENIEEERQDAAECSSDADGDGPQPECDDVGESVLPEVAHRLRDQKHQRRPADQPPRGVDHPVVPAQRDKASDPEERCSAHVITCEREAVLQRTDRTSCGIELARRPRAARSPIGDRQGQRDDEEEEQDGGNSRRAERRCLHDVSGMMKAIAQPRGFDVVASIRPHDVYRREDPRTRYHRGPKGDPKRHRLPDAPRDERTIDRDHNDVTVVENEEKERQQQ